MIHDSPRFVDLHSPASFREELSKHIKMAPSASPSIAGNHEALKPAHNILDFPAEILLSIFEHVEGWDGDASPHRPVWHGTRRNIGDIRNTRLVCRRFCNVISQLLVRVVRVGADRASLERLDRISRHPTIVKGVHTVRVNLHFYTSEFLDFGRLLSHQADQISLRSDEYNDHCFYRHNHETVCERRAQLEEVRDTLSRISSAEPGWHDSEGALDLEKDDQGCRARLLEVHRQYATLFSEQKSLLETGNFSRTIGLAVARMPRARKLVFSDADEKHIDERHLSLLDLGTDVWSALCSLMLQPLTTYESRCNGYDPPSYGCIIRTLNAVRNAGAWPKNIDITFCTKLFALGAPGKPLFTPDTRRDFSSGMRQLRHFSFKHNDVINEEQVERLQEFMSACLDTPCLQTLHLNMRPATGSCILIDMRDVMGFRTRPNLTGIDLAVVGIHLSTVARLLRRLPEPMDYIRFSDVRLLTSPEEEGTWEEALDLLREKSCRSWKLYLPSGAERYSLPTMDYYAIFYNGDVSSPSAAERYIAKVIPGEPNPLRALRERGQKPDGKQSFAMEE
jgi:hypothetical protein